MTKRKEVSILVLIFLIISAFIVAAASGAFAETFKMTWQIDDSNVANIKIMCSVDGGEIYEYGIVESSIKEFIVTYTLGEQMICKPCSSAEGFNDVCSYGFVGLLEPETLDKPNHIGIEKNNP